jgi:hypothetical protein
MSRFISKQVVEPDTFLEGLWDQVTYFHVVLLTLLAATGVSRPALKSGRRRQMYNPL